MTHTYFKNNIKLGNILEFEIPHLFTAVVTFNHVRMSVICTEVGLAIDQVIPDTRSHWVGYGKEKSYPINSFCPSNLPIPEGYL